MLAACVIGGACLEAFSPPLKQNLPNKSLSLKDLSEQVKNLKSAPALENLKTALMSVLKFAPKTKKLCG